MQWARVRFPVFPVFPMLHLTKFTSIKTPVTLSKLFSLHSVTYDRSSQLLYGHFFFNKVPFTLTSYQLSPVSGSSSWRCVPCIPSLFPSSMNKDEDLNVRRSVMQVCHFLLSVNFHLKSQMQCDLFLPHIQRQKMFWIVLFDCFFLYSRSCHESQQKSLGTPFPLTVMWFSKGS